MGRLGEFLGLTQLFDERLCVLCAAAGRARDRVFRPAVADDIVDDLHARDPNPRRPQAKGLLADGSVVLGRDALQVRQDKVLHDGVGDPHVTHFRPRHKAVVVLHPRPQRGRGPDDARGRQSGGVVVIRNGPSPTAHNVHEGRAIARVGGVVGVATVAFRVKEFLARIHFDLVIRVRENGGRQCDQRKGRSGFKVGHSALLNECAKATPLGSRRVDPDQRRRV